MVETGVKIVFGIKYTNISIKIKKHDEINSLISEISNNLNKNALILLKTALISMDNLYYVLDLLDVLKANYDGKHTISLTDPESRWMMDKK